MVDLKIESDFYEDESAAIGIKNFTLTRLTEFALDIQIEFSYPPNITQSVLDPDNLVITFLDPLVFMDAWDYQ